jgi:phage gp36-like protein
MPYVTQQQMIDRVSEAMLIALTDRSDMPTGSIDTATLNRALADTDAVINGYLAARYQLPLATVPALVADLAGAICLWKLHVTSPEEKVKADYEAAIKTLRDIANGVVCIPDAAGVQAAVSGAQGVQVTDRERPFTADNMKGFI